MCGGHRCKFRNGRLDMLPEWRTYSNGKTSLSVGGRSRKPGSRGNPVYQHDTRWRERRLRHGALPRHIRPRKGGCGIGGKRVSFRGNRHRNFETVSPRRRDQRPSLTATAENNRFLIGKLSLHADETVVTYLWNCCSMPMKPKTDAER